MQFQDDVIDEVIQRTDLVELIGQDVRLRRTGSSYVGLCPFHSEKTPSFHVTPAKQLYYCFGCHAGGNAITYMMEYHNYTFVEAVRILAERAGIRLPEESLTPKQREASEKKTALLEIYKTAAGFYFYQLRSPGGERGLSYLRERGLGDNTIRSFGLGYAQQSGSPLYKYLKSRNYPDELLLESGLFHFDEKRGVSDRFWNRVMFPIQDLRGRVIGFGGRVMGEGKPKYLNSPETLLFNKRKQLYALNFAKSTRRGYFILCEGYMDVITMHQAGFNNACASLGTALTPEQCALLSRYTGEVLLLYDSDSAGVNAALRAIPLLKDAGITPRVVNLSPCKDPDEFIRKRGPEALEQLLEAAENAFLFELRLKEGSYRRSDPAEWTAFQKEAARMLLGIPEEMERQNYLEAVCGRYGFDRGSMERLLSKMAAEGTPAESYRPPRSGAARREKQDGFVTTQRLMLTYLANEPEAYAQTKDLITEEDFTDPLCARVAKELYRQLRGGRVSEAELITAFPDSEEQRAVVEIFHTSIPVNSQAELDRAFTDTVIRLLSSGNDARLMSSDLTDMGVFQRYIETKQKLEIFQNGKLLHIPWREAGTDF